MDFIENLGMRGIARSVTFADTWVSLVRQKLEPKDGYVWQRFVEEGRSSGTNVSSVGKKLATKIIKEVVGNEGKSN